jgi:hypothetical protein
MAILKKPKWKKGERFSYREQARLRAELIWGLRVRKNVVRYAK